ncbi:MAG: PAS domain S-box protein [Acetobacteraceae bacterium]|nr:PAS domain S-box protein [Acetobacteraceae bacterium]
MPAPAPHQTGLVAIQPGDAAWLTYQALDRSDDIVVLLEADAAAKTGEAVVIAVNGAFRRASGFSGDQIVGRLAAELFPIGAQAQTLTNAIRERVSLRTELACGRAGGGTFMLGFHLMAAPEWTPGRVCFTVLGRDITALLEARQMQNSVQHLLAKVFMSVDEGVVILNAAGSILMTNSRIDRLLGYKPNELVGRRSVDLAAPGSRASIAEAAKKQMEHGTDETYVAPLLKADGSQVVASITSLLVSTGDAKQFRILTIRAQVAGAAGTRSETAGRTRLVGMDEVRAAMGDRWQAVAARAMATAEAIVKRRCGDQDSYSRVDDTSFLICFGTLNEQDASFRAAMIGREIRERLIGQGGEPDTAELRSIAASSRIQDQGQTATALHATLLDGLDGQVARLEREAREALKAAAAGTACDLKRVTGHNPRETLAMQVNLPGELERGVIGALAILPEAETRTFDLDGLLVGLAAHQAIAGMARGNTIPFLVNVRFDVFATRAATERYLATCLKVDQRVSSHLIMMLSAIPRGLLKTRQLECVNRLRPFCRGVGYHVDDMASLAALDMSFTADPIVSMPATVLDADDPEKLMTLIGSLHARRTRILIREVTSEEDAALLRTIGVDMISMGGRAD